MQPRAEFTSSGHRFYFPEGHPVECHDSVNRAEQPRQGERILGEDHYVIIADESGQLTALNLATRGALIPQGARIVGVRGFPEVTTRDIRRRAPDRLSHDELRIFDGSPPAYRPADHAEVDMIVRAHNPLGSLPRIDDERFDEDGLAILRAAQTLPALGRRVPGEESPTDNLTYELLGFMTNRGEFVTWLGPSNRGVQAIDICAANALTQNRMEQALVREAVGRVFSGTSLPDYLHAMCPGVWKYLREYDRRYGTHFLPDVDPCSPTTYGRYEPLGQEEETTFRRLVTLALQGVVGLA